MKRIRLLYAIYVGLVLRVLNDMLNIETCTYR